MRSSSPPPAMQLPPMMRSYSPTYKAVFSTICDAVTTWDAVTICNAILFPTTCDAVLPTTCDWFFPTTCDGRFLRCRFSLPPAPGLSPPHLTMRPFPLAAMRSSRRGDFLQHLRCGFASPPMRSFSTTYNAIFYTTCNGGFCITFPIIYVCTIIITLLKAGLPVCNLFKR